ncbi:MAG TPA: HigA family addiction module antitoxin [Micropepsaceae bacterium]|jgi:addiction module HigA family antidote|nr:HigA family addiction module antitoxin [Micropepsaceae bacterium]
MNRIPTHPGAVLREDVFPALKMSKTKIAAALGISRSMLYAILAEDVPITPNIALRLGKFLGNGAEIWMDMQVARDLAVTARDMKRELDAVRKAAA